jgi:hypothetical protein
MNAVLSQPDRFATFARPDLSEAEKLRRVKVTATLISRFRMSGKSAVSFRCTVCNGRVDVEGTPGRGGQVTGSHGKCRTANCIAWEE